MITKSQYYILLCCIAVVYILGIVCPVLELDSAQFSTMALRMAVENDFTHLIKGAADYLDKPHMHFWLAALSYKIFGYSAWAYRLPTILLSALAAYSCYGLAKLLYNKNAGLIASLVYLTAQAIVLANIDVKTDGVLTAFTIFAIWQLATYIEEGKLSAIVLGAIGTGFAFSTKGQIAILVIGICLFCHLLYTRKWQRLWSWKVLVALVAFGVAVTPMLYAYYVQFDMHPEKIIRGKSDRSGIFFIFWEQSFERMSGTGMGKDHNDYFFFYHTLLWTFLPWTFIMLGGIYQKVKSLVQVKFKYDKRYEFLTVGTILIVLQIISFAQFKLPHYLNIIMPVLAVLTASYLVYLFEEQKVKPLKIILNLQYFVLAIIVILACFLAFVPFGLPKWYVLLFMLFVLTAIIYTIVKEQHALAKIVVLTVFAAVFTNTVMNGHFYPNLLQYQAGYVMGNKLKNENVPTQDIYKYREEFSWALDFSTKRYTPIVSLDEVKAKVNAGEAVWLYLDKKHLEDLKSEGLSYDKALETPSYRISKLSLKFIMPSTREKQLGYKYLVHITK
ncbi:ArnT family glycosyltransferase [Zhouia sp. PK063]|uniref:ArnT family glycosyltransferase n=1 Tax=Zhouia sp. PK063 TaxID=3373602 RepID=UPI0037ADD4BB